MRKVRTLPLLAGLTALVVAAAVAMACSGSETKVSGSFDASGRFVLANAWDKNGAPIENAKGMVLQSFTTDDNVVIAASNLAGKQVCLWGELDAAKQTMHVAGFKECAAGACGTKSASAQTAGAGAGCCASKTDAAVASNKGASCAAKTDAAMASNKGASCAAKTDAAVAGNKGAGCAAKTDAATAGSGEGCAAKAAKVATVDAATAGAGAGCCAAKEAAAKTANSGSGCTGTDAAAAKANKMASAAPKTDAVAASMIVYSVSGMTCGGCASKVEGAVAKLALPNVAGCTVDLEKAQAIVTTTGDVDREAIQKAITAAGFPAQPAAAEEAKG